MCKIQNQTAGILGACKVANKNMQILWRRVALGRWVARFVARLHATAVPPGLNQDSRHLSKIQNGRPKQRHGQHTPARQKNIQKKLCIPRQNMAALRVRIQTSLKNT
jgi:hypothetical protein